MSNGTGEIVAFKPKAVVETGLFDESASGAARVADNDHNRNGRDDQGPPIGATAWMCAHCEDFAFYVLPSEIRCYRCHRPQAF